MRILPSAALLCAALALGGCVQVSAPPPAYVVDPHDPGQRAVAGGLIGAGAGAAIGAMAGGGRGAALGALAGGAVGAATGAATAEPEPPPAYAQGYYDQYGYWHPY